MCYLLDGRKSGSTYYTDVVNAYNTSLTRSNPTSLCIGRHSCGCGQCSEYAIFANGYRSDYTKYMDAYNSSLVRLTDKNTTLTYTGSAPGVVGINNGVIIAGRC